MQISLDILENIILEQKSLGKKIVFTNGCFDIIHAGHVEYLSKAKQLGDYLIVGLNTDNSVRILKGQNRPINNESDRAVVLSALKPVDFVVLFNDETPINLIKKLIPDVLVKGGDYSIENIVGADFVAENGGKVIIIPLLDGKSTSNIANKLLDK